MVHSVSEHHIFNHLWIQYFTMIFSPKSMSKQAFMKSAPVLAEHEIYSRHTQCNTIHISIAHVFKYLFVSFSEPMVSRFLNTKNNSIVALFHLLRWMGFEDAKCVQNSLIMLNGEV